MKTKVLKLLALALLGTIYGCSTDPYRIKPTAERNVVEICAAGLDRSVTAKLDAQLKYKGGAADVEFKNSLRGAILNMLAEQNLPPEDRAKTLENIFDKYQKCIDTRMKEEAAVGRRMSVLACKNSCCKQDDCAKDCPMVEIEGIPVPVNDGANCKTYTTTSFGCTTYPNGFTWCGMLPKDVSYTNMRQCSKSCGSATQL